MKLSDLNKGMTATVVGLDGCSQFKRRLFSLGLAKGSNFTLKEVSVRRHVFEIELESGSLLALRQGEAAKIEVAECET